MTEQTQSNNESHESHDDHVTATPFEMLASLTQAVDQVLRGGRVIPEVAQARLEICKQCIHLIPEKNRCSICGCYMNAKTYIARASCPDSPPKWKPIIRPRR